MTLPSDWIALAAPGASAALSPTGAEPMSWRIDGRELLWHGDPVHWERRAPILFPVVGASVDERVRIGDRTYPMPRHGFARESTFALVERSPTSVRLRLTDSDATRAHYPFRFRLDVVATLTPEALSIAFEVANTDTDDIPYGLGFHPAFPWPFDGGAKEAYAVAFATEERPDIPDITSFGLIRPGARKLPLDGRRLPLDPAAFTEALCLFDVKSRSLRFTGPSSAAIAYAVENFPHLALWTKPTAPFLSIEAWTSHADPEGFTGDLFERPYMRRLPPGATSRHAVTMTWHPPGAER